MIHAQEDHSSSSGQPHIAAGMTMFTHFEYEITAVTPCVLYQNNLSCDNSKTKGVMPADGMCHCPPETT